MPGATPRGYPYPLGTEPADGSANIEALARAVDGDLTAALASSVPTGMVVPFAGLSTTLPGWLVCQGQAVSRSTYAALFAAIGTTWGAGDGTSTFNVPNIVAGRTIVGPDPGDPAMNAPGKAGGAKTHTLTVAEIPAHAHGWIGNVTASNNVAGTGGMQGTQTTARAAIDSTGGGQPHNNMPPYITMHHFIKT